MISYGTTDVTDPAIWTLAEIRLRPQTVDNTFTNALVDLTWSPSEAFSLTGGLQYKKYEFDTSELRRSNGTTANQEAHPAGKRAGHAEVAVRAAGDAVRASACLPARTRSGWCPT